MVGFFINMRSLSGNNFAWVLYLIDGLVSVFAIVSFVLLLVKLKRIKKNNLTDELNEDEVVDCEQRIAVIDQVSKKIDIDKLEYDLLKLKHLKSSKIISALEFDELRNRLIGKDDIQKESKEKIKG